MPFSIYKIEVSSFDDSISIEDRELSNEDLGYLSYSDWSAWAKIDFKVNNDDTLLLLYDKAFTEALELWGDELQILINKLLKLKTKIIEDSLELENANIMYLNKFIETLRYISKMSCVFVMA